jgi:acylphosphatase
MLWASLIWLICATDSLVAAVPMQGGPPLSQPTTRSVTHPAATRAAASSDSLRRAHVTVTGRVQGVGFRAFTQDQAHKLGLTGWVLNRADGSVEALIEGPARQVEQMLKLIKGGPPGARVDSLRLTDERYTGEFQDFQVRQEEMLRNLPGR